MAQHSYEEVAEKFAIACIVWAIKDKGLVALTRDIGQFLKAQGIQRHDPQAQPHFGTLTEKALELAKKIVREDLSKKGKPE